VGVLLLLASSAVQSATIIAWGDNSTGQLNLPPSATNVAAIATGGNSLLRIQGVGNRVHIVEATTNLGASAVWQAVRTNTLGPSGALNVTNATGSDPQRCFRAREAQ
jgi:hypothetical protein